MKKVFLAAVSVFAMAAYAVAGQVFKVPSADSLHPAPALYGGVSYSTNTNSGDALLGGTTNYVTGKCVVYGAIFSQGTAEDYVAFYDTDTVVAGAVTGEVFRLYNVGQSTNADSADAATMGPNLLPYPVRFKKGFAWHIQDHTAALGYDSVTVLYLKEQ